MPSKWNPPDLDHLITLYRSGLSVKRLADSCGVSRRAIDRVLRDSGITPRGRREAELLKWSQMSSAQRRRQTAAAHIASRRTHSADRQMRHAIGRQAVGRMTPTERELREWLANRRIGSIPQQAIGPYNADLGCYPVAVEIFGGNWHFHGRHLARLPQRVRYLFDAGWHQFVIVVNRSHPLMPVVADELARFIRRARRNPSATREYWMVGGNGQFMTSCSANDAQLTIMPAFGLGRNPITGRYERIGR